MADVPVVGGDKNTWGAKLNTFLSVSHETSGANGGMGKASHTIYLPSPGTVQTTLEDRLRKIVYISDFTDNNLNTAVSSIGATPTTLYFDVNAVCSATLVIPNTIQLVIPVGTSIDITGTLTINSSFSCDRYRIFTGGGTVVLGLSNKAYPEWWGFATASTDTLNSEALQAAINSRASEVSVANGAYSYNTDITIGRALTFQGMGASENSVSQGSAGYSTTTLNYTGTGIGIKLAGATSGMANIHLADFNLVGTAVAAGGIQYGSNGALNYVTHSSAKNITVQGFVGIGAYGIRLSNVLETYFENIQTRLNYDGLVSLSGDVATTIRTKNFYSGSNERNGYRFTGYISGSSFCDVIAESNKYEGLYIYGSGLDNRFTANDFYSYYSEGNQVNGGLSPIVIDSADSDGTPLYNNFFGGYVSDPVGVKHISLGKVGRTTFNYITLTSYGAGFMAATSDTSDCVFNTWSISATNTNVTGNAFNRVTVNGGQIPYKLGGIIAANAELNLSFAGGIMSITDITRNKSAIISLNGTANTVSILSDPDSGFSLTSVNEKIRVHFSGGVYRLANTTAGVDAVSVIASVVNVGGI